MRPIFRPIALALSLTLCASSALAADTKQVCGDAYNKAQELRDKTSLLAARDELRTCSQSTCKDFIVKSCTEWLADVEKRIPSVVFVAQTSTGDAVVDVKVSDGKRTVAASLDGKAIEMDPGAYSFTFTTSGGQSVTVKTIVVESQKAQIVKATFPVDAPPKPVDTGATSGSTPTAVAPSAPSPPSGGPIDSGVHTTTSDGGGAYRIAGWSLLGGGVLIGGVGGVLYALGSSSASGAHCGIAGIANACLTPSDKSTYDSAQSQESLGLGLAIGGGAVAIAGLVVLLIAPSGTSAAPTVSLGGVTLTSFNVGPTGFALGGRF